MLFGMNDEQVLSQFFGEFKRMPTYEEMKDLFGVASKNTVAYRINKLIESGFLNKEGNKLSLAQTGYVMKLGTVQAGFPTAVVTLQ
jgi:DNA-binding Lrp family transcriptional regulator